MFIYYIVLVFLVIRLLVSLNNLIYVRNFHRTSSSHPTYHKFSVLIPSRDEANRLPGILNDLCNQHYKEFEVLIYNDESTDNTQEIIEHYSNNNARIKGIPTVIKPSDWQGKNHACNQLAMHATGDYFIFLDADTRVSPHFLEKVNQQANYFTPHLLSYFPTQEMPTFAEKTSVPIMNWVLQSLLPFELANKETHYTLSAANGQCMIFERHAYLNNKWHEQFKNQCVEDILIARKMKKEGYKTLVSLGGDIVSCRMYNNYAEAITGFSKNILSYFPGKEIGALIYLTLTLLFVPALFASKGGALLLLTLLILHRTVVSYTNQQNTWCNIVLHPFQMVTFALLIINALIKKNQGYLWKNRLVR